jgi:hypothetical protein
MYTLLNKKRYGLNIIFGLFLSIFMPFVIAIKMITDEGAGSDEEKLAKVIDAKIDKSVKDSVNISIEEAKKGMITVDQLNKTLETLGIKDGVIGDINKALDDQGIEMKKIVESKSKSETVDDILAANHKSILEAVKKKGTHEFTIKTDVLRSSVSGNTLAQTIPGIGQLPFGITGLRTAFRANEIDAESNGVVRYIDQATATRNAAGVLEGAQYPESAITWIEHTMTLQKIGDTIPVSMESLRFLSYIRSELMRLLEVNMAIVDNSQLWSGNNNPPQLNGLYTQVPTFDPDAYTGKTVLNPNLADLLLALRVEIMRNRQSKYNPDTVIMHPDDILDLKWIKDDINQYVRVPFADQNGSVVDGMKIIENSTVTPGSLVIGDFRYANIWNSGGVDVEIGWINDQFIHDMTTIKARRMTNLLIRTVDLTGFLKVPSIDLALAAIVKE